MYKKERFIYILDYHIYMKNLFDLMRKSNRKETVLEINEETKIHFILVSQEVIYKVEKLKEESMAQASEDSVEISVGEKKE